MMKRILIGPVLLDRINRFRVFTRYLAGNGMVNIAISIQRPPLHGWNIADMA